MAISSFIDVNISNHLFQQAFVILPFTSRWVRENIHFKDSQNIAKDVLGRLNFSEQLQKGRNFAKT